MGNGHADFYVRDWAAFNLLLQFSVHPRKAPWGQGQNTALCPPLYGKEKKLGFRVPWPRWSLMAQAWFLLCLRLWIGYIQLIMMLRTKSFTKGLAEKSKNFIDICRKCLKLKIIGLELQIHKDMLYFAYLFLKCWNSGKLNLKLMNLVFQNK
jgi:hypothetical protein